MRGQGEEAGLEVGTTPGLPPSMVFQAVQKCTRQKCACEAPDKSLAASQTFTPIFKRKGKAVRFTDAVEEQKASVYRWQLQWRLVLSPAEPQHPTRVGWCMGSQMDPGTDLLLGLLRVSSNHFLHYARPYFLGKPFLILCPSKMQMPSEKQL